MKRKTLKIKIYFQLGIQKLLTKTLKLKKKIFDIFFLNLTAFKLETTFPILKT